MAEKQSQDRNQHQSRVNAAIEEMIQDQQFYLPQALGLKMKTPERGSDDQILGHGQSVDSNPRQRQSKTRKGPEQQKRVASNPNKGTEQFAPEFGQTYSLPQPMFHPQQMNATHQPFSQPPQVHFIAKQQKFYQISPQRGQEQQTMPIMFDRRPYTSSMLQQVLQKRNSGAKQNSQIAALYLANQRPKLPTTNEIMQQANAHNAHVMHQLSQIQAQNTYQPQRKKNNLSVPRSKPQLAQDDLEELHRLRQLTYDLKDENSRLKSLQKMHETEMMRKEKAIEDFLMQNQFIQSAQKQSQLAPIAVTASKYQQETFLLMALKKQVRQLSQKLAKREESYQSNSRVQELEQEVDELRYLLQSKSMPTTQDQVFDADHKLIDLLQKKEEQIQQLQQALQQPDANQTSELYKNEIEKLKSMLDSQEKGYVQTIRKLTEQINAQSASLDKAENKIQKLTQQLEPSDPILTELKLVSPILAMNYKIADRLTFAAELKRGFPTYVPSPQVEQYIQDQEYHLIAMQLPNLQLPKTRLDTYEGETSDQIKCDFEGCTQQGEPLTFEQRQYIMARYLQVIQGGDVYVNTLALQDDLLKQKQPQRQKTASDEQMLDIAEICFVKIAEILTRLGLTVREAFCKYAVQEELNDSKTILELIVPSAFFEAIRLELGIQELSDLEAACILRVLAKPELGNAIILNEFALIMENFGVPLVGQTIASEADDYRPDGEDKPRSFDLTKIDTEGMDLLKDVARFLLKEYQHPREFFAKYIKNNVDINTETKQYKVDILSQKDFYLKIKIANIRKTLSQNESIDKELCLDPHKYPTVFNMKTFVKALEDIAEEEQQKMFEIEKQEEERLQQELANTNSQSLEKQESKERPSLVVADYAQEVKPEVPSFGKGTRKSRKQNISKFQALGVVEEVNSEAAMSIKDDDSRLGSNQIRSSHRLDEDSPTQKHLLNRSLSGRQESVTLREVQQLSTDKLDSEEDNQDQQEPEYRFE